MSILPRRAVVLAGIALGGSASAQRPAGPPAVGFLSLGGAEQLLAELDALREGMTKNGLRDGIDYRLVFRAADGDAGRLPRLARELAAEGSRLVVTRGTTAVRATHDALPDMPIVMSGSADPVAMGLARSLARPGGRITGISVLGDEVIGKQMQLLKELVPTAKTFAAVLQADNPGNDVIRRDLSAAAEGLGVELRTRAIRAPEEIADAFGWAAKLPADGVYVIIDPVFLKHREAIFRAALAERLPTVSGHDLLARAGALAVYTLDHLAITRESARYVAAILRGADPGGLPIEQPTKLSLIVNLRTAKALGLAIPPSILARADEVIE